MDAQDIKAFRAVAHYLSFTRAAEALFVSQSAVSKRVIRLEAELGLRLLERTKRSISLTNAGLVLYRESEGLLSQVDMVLEDVRQAAAEVRHDLKLGIMGPPLARQLLPAFRLLKSKHSEVTLSYCCRNFEELYRLLENNQIDAAVTLDLGLRTLPDVETQELFVGKSLLLLPLSHRWITTGEGDYSRLHEETFVVLSPRASVRGYEYVRETCAGWGFEPRRTIVCNSTDEALFQIEAGQGIGVLPSFDCPPPGMLDVYCHVIDDADKGLPVVLAWSRRNKNTGLLLLRHSLQLPEYRSSYG